MRVTQQPQRFIDEQDGQPIEEIEPEGSRFKSIAIKRLDDGIEVRALEHGTENVVEVTAELTEQRYRGVEVADDTSVDDDLEDAMELFGYTLIDKAVKSY
jgi:hypothetical protein